MDRIIAILAGTLLFWAGPALGSSKHPAYPGTYHYADAFHVNNEYFKNGSRWFFEIKGDTSGFPEDEVVLRDCSTPEFRCVDLWNLRMAVPRSGPLTVGMKYQVEGLVFTVLECHDSTFGHVAQPTCEAAMIEADCQHLHKREDGYFYRFECTPVEGRRANSPDTGAVHYLIYNRRHGITAFGSSSDYVTEPAARQAALERFLVGDKGFLAAE